MHGSVLVQVSRTSILVTLRLHFYICREQTGLKAYKGLGSGVFIERAGLRCFSPQAYLKDANMTHLLCSHQDRATLNLTSSIYFFLCLQPLLPFYCHFSSAINRILTVIIWRKSACLSDSGYGASQRWWKRPKRLLHVSTFTQFVSVENTSCICCCFKLHPFDLQLWLLCWSAGWTGKSSQQLAVIRFVSCFEHLKWALCVCFPGLWPRE